MDKPFRIRLYLAWGFVLAFVMAGCGSMGGDGGGSKGQAVKVTLSGDKEVPAVQTKATGSGTITVAQDKTVSGSVTTSGIEGTAAHIHEGAGGKNGGVIITLIKNGNTWSVPAGAKLNDAQYKEFQAGNLYVNVHSATHKNGEIRGQLSAK